MGRLTIRFVLLALVWGTAPVGAQSTQSPVSTAGSPWAELARRDLQAVREIMLAHHPGPVDPLNPGYREWLDGGYSRALSLADSVKSLDGVLAVLSYYTTGFLDGHLSWSSSFARRSMLWPGIVVARRGGRYVVYHAEPWVQDAPGRDAEFVSCDGLSMDDRLNRDVLPYEGGIGTLEASRSRLAPLLLLWDENPFRSRPASCVVRERGVTRTLPLAWRGIPRVRADSMRQDAAFGTPPATYAVSAPAADVAWVTVPSFAENVGDNRAGLERLVAQLPSLRDKSLLVFDVRGNRGGNSYWGQQLLRAYFGANYVDSLGARLAAGVYTQWRTSEANTLFVERVTRPRFDQNSPTYRALTELVASLRAAKAAGAELTGPPQAAAKAGATVQTPHPLGSRVILLTDGWCASACLDFADLLLAIPGVRHAGAATFADAIYIDNRSEVLPSGLGSFSFSMKVYRNRPRGHNQPYVPTLRYDGMSWDTASLQEWLLRVGKAEGR